MDLVEARKKAKELAEKKLTGTASDQTDPAQEQKEKIPKAKPKTPKKKPQKEKKESKKQKVITQEEKTLPPPPEENKIQKPETQEIKREPEPSPEEEAFVDLSFGEDLPEVKTKDQDLILEDRKPVSAPPEEIISPKEPAEKKISLPPEPEKVAPVIEKALESESEEDIYERSVDDMVQFGYAEVETEKDLIELLSFRLGSEIYAVSLVKIQQIIKPRPVTLVPGAPEYLMGIISLRGMIIPIFDLRKRLGLEPGEVSRPNRIIIVKVRENVLAGLYVDQVLEVARIPQSSIEPPPAIFSGIEGEFLEGIARHKNNMLIVLNLEQVVLGRKEEGKVSER